MSIEKNKKIVQQFYDAGNSGDMNVAQTSGQAMTTDGRPYNNSYCWIIRIEDGKFVEVTEFMDTELITSTFG